MCGIAGFLRLDGCDAAECRDLVSAMSATLVHRGPDACGVWGEGPVWLAHRRLSIIDCSEAGQQPMHGPGGAVVVFNGEIYNFLELRAHLQSDGYRFRTSSDTEVLLAAYETWGEDCVGRFNGMFAFALWDPARRRLLLARDRAGKKPLFYCLAGTTLAFASEIKALLTLPEIAGSASFDVQALSDFLSLGYILTPKTIYAQVRQLPPASLATADCADLTPRLRVYWDAAAYYTADKLEYTARTREDFLQLFYDAVRIRLRSDVPLGLFLSGGLDSASVARAAAAQVDPPPRAYTVGFGDSSFDESAAAGRSARGLGIDLTILPFVDPDADTLQRLAWHCDSPFADTSLLPFYHLCVATRRHVTVALSGDGADELLAGYPTYRADQYHRLIAALPHWPFRAALAGMRRFVRPTYRKVSWDYKLRQFLQGHAFDSERAHYWWRVIFPEEEKRRLLAPELCALLGDYDPYDEYRRHFVPVRGRPFLDQALYVDLKTWLADDILVKVDRGSMAASLEVRSPFLDYRLIEFLARLPPEAKMTLRAQKVILREALGPTLPEDILRRPKRGFNAPLPAQCRPEAQGWCQGLIHPAFALDGTREDVTFKAFSLTMLRKWKSLADRHLLDRPWSNGNHA